MTTSYKVYWPRRQKLKPNLPPYSPRIPLPHSHTGSRNSILNAEEMYREACPKGAQRWPGTRPKYAYTFGLSASLRLTIYRTGSRCLNSYQDLSPKGRHRHPLVCVGAAQEGTPRRAAARFLSPLPAECHLL